MNISQNKAIHALLYKSSLVAQKENIVLGISKGRTTSLRQLDNTECNELIKYLQTNLKNFEEAKCKPMRSSITAMAHEMGWIQQNDYSRVDNWMLTNSYLKKKLFEYTYEELPKLVSQFKEVYKHYLTKA